jgi:hypothetical protein
MYIKQNSKTIIRLGIIGLFCIFLSACNTLTRLSELGNGPKNSEIINPTKRPNYRPVSMPMPKPKQSPINQIHYGDRVLVHFFAIKELVKSVTS